MQSAYHSLLPKIDGVQQSPGADFEATNVSYSSTDEQAVFSLDIASAYPEEAEIVSWQRTIDFERGKGITIRDAFTLMKTPNEIGSISPPTFFRTMALRASRIWVQSWATHACTMFAWN